MGGAWPTWAVLAFLAVERLIELAVARRNEALVRAAGAVEHGRGLTRMIMIFHAAWFAVFTLETALRGADAPAVPYRVLGSAVALQSLRWWCIGTLGRFWNTKVLVVPGAEPVRRGPYRWVRHPNYLVVAVEIALLPALCGCWGTAAVFGALNPVLLRARIRQEDAALRQAGSASAPTSPANTGSPQLAPREPLPYE
jgi:methyltransferase